MEGYKLTLMAKALKWDGAAGKYEKLDAPIEFFITDIEEVGEFVRTLAYSAEEPLNIEIKRGEV